LRPFDEAQDMLGERNIRVRDVCYAGKFAKAAELVEGTIGNAKGTE
jgi:hypothetical protein